MDLKILLPYKVFAEVKNVKAVTADTNAGSYGFLPQRLDCVAILVPGIFSYETDGVHYLAVDAGILIKTGSQILVSVRNAIGGVEQVGPFEFVRGDDQHGTVDGVEADGRVDLDFGRNLVG